MDISWTEDLSVGVTEIDNQHKELIRRKDELFEAIVAGRGAEELLRTSVYLETYIVTHFATEELYMMRYAFPGFDAHRKKHRDFVAMFLDLKRKLADQGPTNDLVWEVGNYLVNWLNDHITVVDRELGAFLKGKVWTCSSPDRKSVSLTTSAQDHVYRSGNEKDAERMKIVDGTLSEGAYPVALSSGQQTAWLCVPPGMACRIAREGDRGVFMVLTDEGCVIEPAGDASVQLPSATFRIISGDDDLRMTITVSSAKAA